MKNRIRLTESDLRRIVKESVKRIINERWFGNDGNPMVGGHYDDYRTMVSKDILDDLLETITEDDVSSYEEWEKFKDYCEQNPRVFDINAILRVSYDESTGYGSAQFPIIELESIKGDEALDYVAKYPNRKVAKVAVQKLEYILDGLTGDDFEL